MCFFQAGRWDAPAGFPAPAFFGSKRGFATAASKSAQHEFLNAAYPLATIAAVFIKGTPMQESPFKGKTGIQRLWNALGYSLQGMVSAFRHEYAFRQECLLAALLIPAAFFIPVGGAERALMIASV
ncbi:MAG TPA: diacylglycerol kinase, partial [Burkholderiales bacterium]|nr:diacylglycerol kinase [Burkholderiales bacterium]